MVPSLSSKKSISRFNGKVSNGIPETSKILPNIVELFTPEPNVFINCNHRVTNVMINYL